MDFAEGLVLSSYKEIELDASLPAKKIYKLRGFVETEYHQILTDNGEYLCYDVMKK